MKKNLLHEIMSLAWQLVKRNGFSMSEALKCAWANMKLKTAMKQRIVKFYFRFLSVRLNRLKNKLLANYLRNRGNDLATVRNSAFCVAILSNNSFICKYNIFFRKYELSVAIL